jgi:hypothetical protein
LYDILANEVATDPLVRGYAGMTDQQLIDSLNALDRIRELIVMSAGDIMEAIDGVEFTALSAALKARVDRVLGLGSEIIIGPGNAHNAVQEILAAFGGASATISSLEATRDVAISRADEIGSAFVTIKILHQWGIR